MFLAKVGNRFCKKNMLEQTDMSESRFNWSRFCFIDRKKSSRRNNNPEVYVLGKLLDDGCQRDERRAV